MTWKVFFDALWLSIFYAIINYQFKTSELKNVEKLVKQTVQALKPYKNGLGMCIYIQCVIPENIHTPPPLTDGQWNFLRVGGAKG